MAASMATRPARRRCRMIHWGFACTFIIASIRTSAAFALVPRECLAPSPLKGIGRVGVDVRTRRPFVPVRRSMSRDVGNSGKTKLGMASQEDSDIDSASSSPSPSSLSTPLDRPLLAMVDAAALLVFAGIGKASHGTNSDADDGSGIVSALQTVGTALPFLVAWFATSPITGVYKVKERKDEQGNLMRDTVLQTAPGWALAIPLGCVLRGLIRGYTPPLPFVVVAMVATLVLLCAGRVAFSVLEDFFVELV